MLQKILDAFNSIYEFFMMLGEAIRNMITSTLELIRLLTSIPTNLGLLVGTLPPWLMAVATTTIGVSVVYVLLGRSTGK